jgi:23S rRNA pseudouridine955/2504/2580 synthase
MSITVTIIEQQDIGLRFDRWVKKSFPRVAFGELQKWLRTGQVRVNKKRIKAGYILQDQDSVRFPPHFVEFQSTYTSDDKPIGNKRTRSFLQQSIIFEDESCIILNKPQGLSVQGGTGLRDYVDLYLDNLLEDQQEPLKITHRLDKDTAGLLILAKNVEAARFYTKAFETKNIFKMYHAVVVGRPKSPKGTIDLPIGKMRGIERERMSSKAEHVDEAITEYHELVYDRARHITLLALHPLTGRTHQLRVHMLEGLGCSILGDGKYGGQEAHPLEEEVTLHLAATSLSFTSMTGAPVSVTIPIPDFFVLV